MYHQLLSKKAMFFASLVLSVFSSAVSHTAMASAPMCDADPQWMFHRARFFPHDAGRF